jgi:hypothetical protein
LQAPDCLSTADRLESIEKILLKHQRRNKTRNRQQGWQKLTARPVFANEESFESWTEKLLLAIEDPEPLGLGTEVASLARVDHSSHHPITAAIKIDCDKPQLTSFHVEELRTI